VSSPVQIRDLEVTYSGRKREQVAAVRGVILSIDKGAFAVLLGPSGCRKSTVLNAVAGLISPTGCTLTVGETTFHDRQRRITSSRSGAALAWCSSRTVRVVRPVGRVPGQARGLPAVSTQARR